MKFKEICIAGFRAFGYPRTINLNSQIVLIYGGNGTGKTSIFDAIQWCLYGYVDRLQGSRDFIGTDPIKNVFTNQIPDIQLDVEDDLGREYVITRSNAGSIEEGLVVKVRNETIRGEAAQKIINQILPEYLFDGVVYLGQERITKFINKNPRDRYDIVSQIFGLKAVSEFYSALNSQINLLETRASSIKGEADGIETKIQATEGVLRKEVNDILQRIGYDITTTSLTSLGQQASELVKKAATFTQNPIFEVTFEKERILSNIQALEALLFNLDKQIDYTRREKRSLETILTEWLELSNIKNTMEQRKLELASLLRNKDEQRQKMKLFQKEYDLLTVKLTKLNVEVERRASETYDILDLLRKSLQHLEGDECPVCEQKINPIETKQKVQHRINEVDKPLLELNSQINELMEKSKEVSLQIATLDKAISARSDEADNLRKEIARIDRQVEEFKARAEAPKEIELQNLEHYLRQKLDQTESETQKLSTLREELTRYSLILQYLDKKTIFDAEIESTPQLKKQLQLIQAKLDKVYYLTQALRKADQASRNAELETIREFSNRYESAIRSNYKRLDPHPLFKNLKIRSTNVIKAGGEIYFDAQYRDISANVHSVLSQAQQNSVALCLFLTFNLAQKDRTNPILLDDPVQSMDEVNILSLVDLLRMIQKSRQIIVATHNERFFALLTERLRPLDTSQSQIRHVIRSFLEDGPDIETEIKLYEPLPTTVEQYL